MAFNNGFPIGYQPVQYQNPYQYQQPVQYQQAPQTPSRMIEVYAVDNEKAVSDMPVSNGNTQMVIAKDDSFIAVKAVGLDGTVAVQYYDKRPPAPPAPSFDPAIYVTREELETRLAAFQRPTRAKKETVTEE